MSTLPESYEKFNSDVSEKIHNLAKQAAKSTLIARITISSTT